MQAAPAAALVEHVDPSDPSKVLYLTCLKCAEWARLQQASLEALSRLAEDAAARDEVVAALREGSDRALAAEARQAEALAAAERRRAAAEAEQLRRRDEMLAILRAREARAGHANGKR